ncbi:ABC transporter ATP-binding protein [Actinoplanes sp. NPDC049265]|uniref:ABC transporter ATP-binding protein n=1 Tax=Actinoplanes sp. NPDC049265 TaxID=3363902 RepID=UPI0037227531
MIECSGIRFSYAGHEALAGVNLSVRGGEIVALLGTNGAGKTTLVDVIRGLLKPATGTVRVLGRDPRRERRVLAPLIGLVPQDSGFAGGLTAAETLRLWTGLNGRAATGSLAEVDLASRARVKVRHLSGGERRRLDLAVALSGDPPLLVLDEPTTGLDPESRGAAWDVLRDRVAAGATVLVTTHYLEEASQYADRFVVLHEGQVARSGSGDAAEAFRAALAGDGSMGEER